MIKKANPVEQATHAYNPAPDEIDSKELHTFSRVVRLRYKTFNGRIEYYKALSDSTFRNGFDKHPILFEAVVLIVQYRMDYDSPIFDA